jgi:hypothetical protein
MNHIKLIITTLCVIMISYDCGCSGGGVSGGVGYIPKITAAQMYNTNDRSNYSFNSGSIVDFSLIVEDYDLNIKTLRVTIYNSSNLETPFQGPLSFDLPEQTTNNMTYTMVGSMTLSEPDGQYSVNLEVLDTTGNISKAFPIYFAIGEVSSQL